MNKGTGAPDEEKLPHKLAWGGRGAGEGKGLFQEPAPSEAGDGCWLMSE